MGDGSAFDPVLDQTGRFVAFASDAHNLIAGPPQGGRVHRVYRREIGNGDAVVLVSRRDGQGGAVNVSRRRPPVDQR